MREKVSALLQAATPERGDEVVELWETHVRQFEEAMDTKGFTLDPIGFGLVKYTDRTLSQIWLLGYTAWRAVETYATPLMLAESLPDQSMHVEALLKLFEKVQILNSVDDVHDFDWPIEVPRRGVEAEDPVDGVIQDIIAIATSYIVLHELRHLTIHDNGETLDPHAEELECDHFAAQTLLERAADYASDSDISVERVNRLRAYGFVLGAFIVSAITPLGQWHESMSHPPLTARLSSLFKGLNIPSGDHFWLFPAALLTGVLKFKGKLGELADQDFTDLKTLVDALIACM